ncbi:Exodeoxyribonuclease III [Crinalium epipsammum PCC 9333]|uniref:Exodeoxyribonuclease III n=1 Tax=Crinalium epipsammum PCC 9333 TaxID=1173022 RepID=K9W2H7_9CYAN|nr:exodeoxyribonuclease III [Crinalium epipsammum]AFZ13967.1 Exodeoxyribonuclease III [Crinalium epipsammum PCC 9333]
MQIATWNVNSIRTRLDHVVQWLQDNPVDALCLQETKVVDDKFPRTLLEELGYHVYTSGQKSYNGVAIISRPPLTDVSTGFTAILGEDVVGDLDEQKRVITGVIDGIRIINLYVPNGSAVGSEKYEYKLRWLKVLREYLQTLLTNKTLAVPGEQVEREGIEICICGDFNIAPEDKDIHDPAPYKGRIMASELERQALIAILELGFADAFRKFNQETGNYTWWDYRTGGFRHNRGWRIDHHYLTPALYKKSISCTIDVAPRKLTQPSDHTPVIVSLSK